MPPKSQKQFKTDVVAQNIEKAKDNVTIEYPIYIYSSKPKELTTTVGKVRSRSIEMPSPAADYVDLFVDGKLVFEGKTEHEWESRIDNSSYDDENAYVKSYCINKVQVYKTYYNPPIYKKLLGKTFIDGKNIPKVTAEVKYYYGGILITTESVKIDTDSFEIGTKSVYRNELIKIIIDDKSLRKIKKLEKSMI